MVCGKCGKRIPDDAVFCSYCGARRERKVCKACGTELKEEQLFCHVCGLKWDEGASRPEESGTGRPADRQMEQLPGEKEIQQTENPITSGRSKTVQRVLCGVYAILIVTLAVTGYFGYYDYYFWSSAYERMTKHRVFAIEQPAFWLCVIAVAAGGIHQIYCICRNRKKKPVKKFHVIISAIIALLAIIFFFLLCWGEGYGIQFMF